MSEQRIIRPNAGFILPTRRFVDVGMPRSGITMSGRYQLVKRNAWGLELGRTPWFDNIILTSGLNRWGTGTPIVGAAIGTGTSTPDAAQTALDTQSTYTTTTGTGHGVVSALGSSPYNNTLTVVYRTGLGALNGNYTEVGVGWASGSMFSRALILDGGGSPTSISVTSSQQLDIVYQLSVYPPLTDVGPTTIAISGTNYDVTGKASNVNTIAGDGSTQWNPNAAYVYGAMGLGDMSSSIQIYSGALGVITGTPSGTSAAGATPANDTYVNNSLNRTASLSYSLAQANVSGGIMSTLCWWTRIAGFQYGFNPVIPKDATKSLVLNYSLTWARR